MSPAEKREVRGNSRADEHVKATANDNNLSESGAKVLARALKKWNQVAMTFVNVLEEWPAARELDGQLDRPPRRGRQYVGKRAHNLSWDGARWRCATCWKSFGKSDTTSTCPGLPEALQAASGEGRRHELWLTAAKDKDTIIVFCTKCGATATSHAKKLSDTCRPFKTSKQQLRALRRGKLPGTRRAIRKPLRVSHRAPAWWSTNGVGDHEETITCVPSEETMEEATEGDVHEPAERKDAWDAGPDSHLEHELEAAFGHGGSDWE